MYLKLSNQDLNIYNFRRKSTHSTVLKQFLRGDIFLEKYVEKIK